MLTSGRYANAGAVAVVKTVGAEQVLTSILKKIAKRFNQRGRNAASKRVFIAAFGKHPGWDDHIDDIGLETDVLVTVKRILYIQGIGSNIDSGSWDKLEDDQRLEKFGHVFVWCMNGDLVVGRLWSSRDGKGRSSYPMVVCVQCSKLSLPWVLTNILPRLEEIEQACIGTTSADDVHRIIEDARNQIRQLVSQDCEPARKIKLKCSHVLAQLAELPEMGPNREGLHRILYHIDREIVHAGSGSGKGGELRPGLIRLPISAPAEQENVLLWTNFLLAKFGLNTHILVIMPLRNCWIDIVIGEPQGLHLYCLRGSVSVVPLTSSIPYRLDSEFLAQTNQLIDDSKSDSKN
ncbi:MAG: hypothetical protein GWN67_01965 [Phycisphaerae bacterium]|nr:hypothetical protein [Phycisphaerae bacterium]NIP55725.1 hypothetical protein [Phycisphaerae bacterium]NIS49905.1 hypothetical protein [Phycisphaerae bacterium]NIU07588.1 hypothetical protein [Phycisphaerae bacterium]NIU55198.1 hypothetical protein [Phycisphaerae bacterium]